MSFMCTLTRYAETVDLEEGEGEPCRPTSRRPEIEARRSRRTGEAAPNSTVLHRRTAALVDRPDWLLGLSHLAELLPTCQSAGVEHRHRARSTAGGCSLRSTAARPRQCWYDALLELLTSARSAGARPFYRAGTRKTDEGRVAGRALRIAWPLACPWRSRAGGSAGRQRSPTGLRCAGLLSLITTNRRSTAPGVRARLSIRSNQSEAHGLQMSSVTSLA